MRDGSRPAARASSPVCLLARSLGESGDSLESLEVPTSSELRGFHRERLASQCSASSCWECCEVLWVPRRVAWCSICFSTSYLWYCFSYLRSLSLSSLLSLSTSAPLYLYHSVLVVSHSSSGLSSTFLYFLVLSCTFLYFLVLLSIF